MESVQVFKKKKISGEINFLKLYFPNNPFHLGFQIYLHIVRKIVMMFSMSFVLNYPFVNTFCMSVHPPFPLD